MEQLFGGAVFLEVWVRVKRGWADNDAVARAARLLNGARIARQLRERHDDEPASSSTRIRTARRASSSRRSPRAHGRVAMVARGAKRPRSELRGVLQAFQPLALSWAGAASSRR